MATVLRPTCLSSPASAHSMRPSPRVERADLQRRSSLEIERSVLAVYRSGTVNGPSQAHRHGRFLFAVEDRARRPVGFTHARA